MPDIGGPAAPPSHNAVTTSGGKVSRFSLSPCSGNRAVGNPLSRQSAGGAFSGLFAAGTAEPSSSLKGPQQGQGRWKTAALHAAIDFEIGEPTGTSEQTRQPNALSRRSL